MNCVNSLSSTDPQKQMAFSWNKKVLLWISEIKSSLFKKNKQPPLKCKWDDIILQTHLCAQ